MSRTDKNTPADISEVKNKGTIPPHTPTKSKASAESSDTLTVGDGRAAIDQDERYLLIQQAAYFYSTERGGAAGNELDDWLRAERDVDTALAQSAP